MSSKLRRLNDEGVRLFSEYLASGANGPAPFHLLSNPETSGPIADAPVLGSAEFDNRFEFGIYLRSLFKAFDSAAIGADRNLWTSLALYWFDRLCPQQSDGSRTVGKDYRYIASSDYRHYYRHLVRSPWFLVHLHGESAKILLIAPKEQIHPLSVHGEILEQIGGRQHVLASRPMVAAANHLYFDKIKGRPRTGVAGRKRGCAERFGTVLKQLDLTFDPDVMPTEQLVGILPSEFERWSSDATNKKGSGKGAHAAPISAEALGA